MRRPMPHPLHIPRRWLAFIAAVLTLGLSSCATDAYPKEQGTILHVSLRGLAKNLDPPVIGTEYANKLGSQVYEGLLAYHPYARPFQLVPALAAQMPTVSEDKLTYTFVLRDDIVFQDSPCFPGGKGRKVTAHDVAFAMKRLAHPESKSTGWWLFAGKLAGFDDFREQLSADIVAAKTAGEPVDTLWGLDREVSGIQVVDEHTIRFTMTEAYPQFLWTMAMNYAAIYPREAVEFYGKEFRNNPVGTGPFQLKDYNPVYRAVFERNPTFRDVRVPDPRNNPADRLPGWDWEQSEKDGWLQHAGKKLPMIDGIEFRFILEDQPRWLYFKAGYSDWLNPPKDNQAEALQGSELAPELVERGVRLTRLTEMGTVYTAINTDDAVMKNVDLRRAMALAIDHTWTIDNLYSGSAVCAMSLIPPDVGGFQGDYHPYKRDDCTADIDAAKALMVKAGYPDGLDASTGKPLRIRFENSGTSTTSRQFGERFRDEMRRIGIEVDIIVNTWPQMNEKMRNRDYQVAGLAWGFDYPDGQNILQLLYGPNQAPGINRSNFTNATFDSLYDITSTMEDSPARSELYALMGRILADQMPWIVRVHRIRPNLQQPWVTGALYSETHDHWFRYAHIDKAQRDARVEEWNQPVYWPVGVAFVGFFGLLGLSIRYQAGAA